MLLLIIEIIYFLNLLSQLFLLLNGLRLSSAFLFAITDIPRPHLTWQFSYLVMEYKSA